MGILGNVEDPNVISDAIAQLKSSGDEIVDRLNASLGAALSQAQAALSKTMADALQGANGAATAQVTAVFAQADALVGSFDGWTLDITIPPISIRLSRPKGTTP
jgi:hypothetical protein